MAFANRLGRENVVFAHKSDLSRKRRVDINKSRYDDMSVFLRIQAIFRQFCPLLCKTQIDSKARSVLT
jgi:hypothetical protein